MLGPVSQWPIPFRTRPGYLLQQRIRGGTGATEQDDLSVLDACSAVARASAYSAFWHQHEPWWVGVRPHPVHSASDTGAAAS